MYVCDTESIRRLDRETIDSGTPGILLMERAAEGVTEAALELTARCKTPRILVVCGKGSNGGDGLAVARQLFNAGKNVTTLLLFPKTDFQGDARTNLLRLENDFCRILESSRPAEWPDFKDFDLIIDAIFGTGFKGEIKDPVRACIEHINASGVRVLAVDTPSGVNSDTGETTGPAVMADLTVTFGLPKAGQLFYPARACVGELRVKDIGFPEALTAGRCGSIRLIGPADARLGLAARQGDEHKNRCGRVLVAAGSTGLTGAACLTAVAALKSGAGVVTLCCPESLHPIFATKLTEIMTHSLPDAKKGFLSSAHAKPILKLALDFDVLVLGPGLGRNAATFTLVRELVARSPVPVVLDADGINAFEGRAELLKKAKSRVVITPHEGELKRLLGAAAIPPGALKRIAFARKTQKGLGTGLVLKGATTVTAFDTDEAWVNTTGNPGMATAGSGDVLTGLIGGLFAQNKDLKQATLTAVYLHGLCGDAGALDLGEYCLTAADLIHYLPKAFREITG